VAVPPRLSLVTLGVSDLGRARAFYRALGWDPVADDNDDVCFFSMAGAHLALWGNADLAADAQVTLDDDPAARFRGVSLAMNLDTPEAVDAAMAEAVAAGARVLTEAHETFWGGYNGYFADPDGHVWEVAHNPGWPIGPDGRPVISA